MTSLDEAMRLTAEINLAREKLAQGVEAIETMQLQRRDHDRKISYAGGMIDAYTAVLGVLKPKDRETVEKRIAALKEQMGDLSV